MAAGRQSCSLRLCEWNWECGSVYRVPAWCTRSPGFPSQHGIKAGALYPGRLLGLERWRQQNQDLKAIHPLWSCRELEMSLGCLTLGLKTYDWAADMVRYLQAWQPEFSPQNTHGRRRQFQVVLWPPLMRDDTYFMKILTGWSAACI